MIDLYIYPCIAVEGRQYGDDTMIISIVSPYVVHPMIRAKYVYQFHFHDVTEEYFLEKQNKVIQPMSYEIAELIADVALLHRDKRTWIIHCEAGISRSPGVAMGLARYIETSPDCNRIGRLFPHYNLHVCRLIQRAMRLKTQRGIK